MRISSKAITEHISWHSLGPAQFALCRARVGAKSDPAVYFQMWSGDGIIEFHELLELPALEKLAAELHALTSSNFKGSFTFRSSLFFVRFEYAGDISLDHLVQGRCISGFWRIPVRSHGRFADRAWSIGCFAEGISSLRSQSVEAAAQQQAPGADGPASIHRK
jgi:hypothetical protein